jgi:hypothetical protein
MATCSNVSDFNCPDTFTSGSVRYSSVVNILSGVIARGPYFVFLILPVTKILALSSADPEMVYFLYRGASLVVGILLENIGSQIEHRLNKHRGKVSNWGQYLSLKIGDDCLAKRHLKTVIYHFMFDLSMCRRSGVPLSALRCFLNPTASSSDGLRVCST